MAWDPREQERLEELEPLYYDVPGHLLAELRVWVGQVIDPLGSDSGPRMLKLLTALRVDDAPGRNDYNGWDNLRAWFVEYCSTPEGMLNLIRAVLVHLPIRQRATALEDILRRGNSGYAVRSDLRGLEYRVPVAAREQVEEAVATAPAGVGQLLTRAWNLAYGIDPRPDDAWTAAYKATEAALRPIIAPGSGASLGRMITDYEAKPDKWDSCIVESRPTFDPNKHTALDAR